MTGTLVNAGAIVLGGLVGLLLKKGIPASLNDSIMKVVGLVVALIGLNGVIKAMLTVDLETGKLSDSGSLLLLISLVVGCIAGEALKLDDRLAGLGLFIERRFEAGGFAKGFVSATLLFCVGAMAIIGAINDGLRGDSNILFIKSMLDGTTAIILASALGYGVLFSAIPVLLFQGGVSLCAVFIEPYISDPLLNMVCMTGYAIVIFIGLNFLFEMKIKTANLLPALVVPVVYYFVSVNL